MTRQQLQQQSKQLAAIAWRRIRHYRSELTIMIGTGMVAYNVFNFSATDRVEFRRVTNAVVYYYESTTLWWIALGTMLMVLGLFLYRRDRH